MFARSRLILPFFVVVLGFSGGIAANGSVRAVSTINLPDGEGSQTVVDDSVPEVTARVARISFLTGNAKIKRIDSEEWENVTLNLPVVEGDEIATDTASRVEIQFDKDQHLRIAQNSFLTVTNLKDQGIALSVSLGTIGIRILSFDQATSYFEIDAPKITFAIQSAGSYRIDAGREGDDLVRVAVSEGGVGRIYSDNAGFTVKDGRTATINTSGPEAGDWKMDDIAAYGDDFDKWSADREATIASRLKDAYYDTYYDDDIYGAEDLDDNGTWVNTADYGYVWRPSPASIRSYADWSPYRYGHWRWVGAYGWTWVNDEPWGWATYHHGRWFYSGGYWNWSPYGYYRQARSWWSPALVVITVVNNNVCWYPLPYRRARYDYNWRYERDRHRRPDNRDNIAKGSPRPSQTPLGPPVRSSLYRKDGPIDELDHVPVSGVVTVSKKDFGVSARTGKRPTDDIAKTVLSKRFEGPPDVELPQYTDLNRRIGRDIVTDRPKDDIAATQVKLGAATRRSNTPLDTELRNKRFYGGREPQVSNDQPARVRGVGGGKFDPPKTGAIDRNPIYQQNDGEKVATPRDSPRFDPSKDNDQPRYVPSVKTPTRREPPAPKDSPRFEPPSERDSPRYTPPVKTPTRREPPAPKDSPRFEPPSEREQPKYSPPVQRQPTRRDPPKSEPKKDDKPAPARVKEYKKPPAPDRR